MDFLVIIICLNVHVTYLFKSDILFGFKSLLWIFSVNLILFIIGYSSIFYYEDHLLCLPLLMMPLLTLLIFVALLITFRKMFHTYPFPSSLFSSDLSNEKSWIFYFLFLFIGTVLPIIIIYYAGNFY